MTDYRKVSGEFERIQKEVGSAKELGVYISYLLGQKEWPGLIGELNALDRSRWEDGWENETLADFLTGMSAWLRTADIAVEGRQIDNVNWSQLAKLFLKISSDFADSAIFRKN